MSFPHFALNSEGQVQAVTEGTVTSFNGPQAYVGSSPLVTEDAVAATDTFNGGLRYRSDGALRVNDGAGSFYAQGFAVTAQGQLCIDTGAVAASGIQGGVATTSDGRVYMSTGGSAYTGPLDLVPGAVVAYGVRALSAAWLGQNIFRLRRDSDDAEMNFAADAVTGDAPVAAITAWLAGANGFLRTWYDQSGNGEDLVQAEPNNQLQWDADILNGKPGFGPNISGDMGSAGNAVLPDGQCSISIVCEQSVVFGVGDAATHYAVLLNPLDNPPALEMYDDDSGNVAGGAMDAEVTGVHLFIGKWEFGSRSLKIDGVAQSLTGFDSGGAVPSITQPAKLNTPDNGGIVGEAICWADVISAGHENSVNANTETYWGL